MACLPPLPDEIAIPSPDAAFQSVTDRETPPLTGPPITGPGIPPLDLTTLKLKKGTWLFNYSSSLASPLGFGQSDGTIRFEAGTAFGIRGSGDMYTRPLTFVPKHKVGSVWIGPLWLPGSAPPNNQGIPILSRDAYDAYLRVTGISTVISNGGFDMEFAKYRWNKTTKKFVVDVSGAAVVDETYVTHLTWTTATAGWPSPADYLTGDVKIKSSGVIAGSLKMGWVSSKWRKIGLEIDAVKGCNFPVFNAARRSIWELLEDAGFEIAKKVADENAIDDVVGGVWTDADLHSTMLTHRQKQVDLNKEWSYHALMIPKYNRDGVLGIMYDDILGGSDTNKIAREGFAVVAHLPTGDPAYWGTEANRKLQDATDSFVRTTIHELSHAMGMHHPDAYNPVEDLDDTYMCQTWSLNDHAFKNHIVYPSNIQWRHSDKTQRRIRHYPDIRMRPGGVQFSEMYGVNGWNPWVPPNDIVPPIPGLQLTIKPLISEVPIGAPVRVEVTLKNDTEYELEVPSDISLKGDAMKGDVQDSNGLRRTFQPLITCADVKEPLTTLEPGSAKTTFLTLFSGKQGSLFPSTGVHTITTILSWNQLDEHGNPARFWIDANTTVMVTGARSPSHAAAAHKVLAEPETLLSLVLAGDHLHRGIEAIQHACDDETLGPHYACIEARRYASPFMSRKADPERARKLVGRRGVVMSRGEREKIERLLKKS